MSVSFVPSTSIVSTEAPVPRNFDALLAPIHEAARDSASLIPTRHSFEIGAQGFELSHFLLLGQRGGGRPVRVGIFAGLDAGRMETVFALQRLLIQYELAPGLAKDFAIFAFPIVNVLGFSPERAPLAEFERRFAAERLDGDVQLFKSEFRKWAFDGLIFLRVDPQAKGFHVAHRSAVLGREVVAPTLQAFEGKIPLRPHPAVLRPSDRYARLADYAHGRLAASAGGPPYPFEIDVFAPGLQPPEAQATGLFLFVQEALRRYRLLISHAANL